MLDRKPWVFSKDPKLMGRWGDFFEIVLPRGFAWENKASKDLGCFLGKDFMNFLDFSLGIELISSSVGFPKTSIINSSWVLAKYVNNVQLFSITFCSW